MAGFLLLGGIVAYLGLAFWLIARWYLPRLMVRLSPEARKGRRYPLALNTYQILHLLHALTFFLVLIWLPVTFVFMAMPLDAGHSLGEMKIFATLHADLGKLAGVELSGTGSQHLSGSAQIEVTAPNRVNYFLYAFGSLIKALMLLSVLLQFRNILASMCNGDSFTAGNSRRLNRAGLVIVAASLVGPAWNWWMSASVINGLAFNTDALSLTPAAHGSLLTLLIGLGVLIASGVIRDAERMQQEQRLTI